MFLLTRLVSRVADQHHAPHHALAMIVHLLIIICEQSVNFVFAQSLVFDTFQTS